jgi:hypothetical protein
MNDREITALLDRLVETFEGAAEDWDDVLARSAEPDRLGVSRTRPGRSRWPGRPRGLILLGATVVLVALIALAVTSPWRRGPTILDRAAAAIALPAAGQILYENITLHVTPTPLPAQARAELLKKLPPDALHPPLAFDAHVRVWLAGTAPHRFHLTESGHVHGRVRGRAATQPLRSAELGGTLASSQALSYDATSGALVPATFRTPVKRSELDVAEFVWQAITSGRAKVDGTTSLHGKPVVRIRVFARISGYLEGVGLYFVDAQTYQPVRVEMDLKKHFFEDALPGFPLLSLSSIQSSILPSVPGRWIIDFNEYRHLAPTAANSGLANIRATHPKARIV